MLHSQVFVLSAYPLSKDYVEHLRQMLGTEITQLTLSELRETSGYRLIQTLWSFRPERLILPIEDENGAALLPITKLLAGFTRARSIQVLSPMDRITEVSRFAIVGDLTRFGWASIACLIEAGRAALELGKLARTPRLDVRPQVGKVLYLKTNLWFGVKAGGSIGHIAGVVNALQQSGKPVTFASAEQPVMVDASVEFHKVLPPKTFGVPYELNNYRFQRRFLKESTAILRGAAFSFIYQRLSAANYLGCVLACKSGVPLVVEYNGSEAWIAKNWGRAMRFHNLAVRAENVMLRHAHTVVTISEVLRDELIDRGVEPKRIVAYPNCVDVRFFDPDIYTKDQSEALREIHGVPTGARLCTFIGTFGQWHGVEVLAHVIVALRQHHYDWLEKHRLHFMLIGDGLKKKEVQYIISSGQAEDICTITGLIPQHQAPRYLAAADILVSPHVANTDGSRFFGSPTKIFEYMAMKKGIVASHLDQIGDVLSPSLSANNLPAQGQTPNEKSAEVAVLTDPGNVDQIVSAIMFLVERPDWYARLANNSRKLALNSYTWRHHVDAILDNLFAH